MLHGPLTQVMALGVWLWIAVRCKLLVHTTARKAGGRRREKEEGDPACGLIDILPNVAQYTATHRGGACDGVTLQYICSTRTSSMTMAKKEAKDEIMTCERYK